MTLKIIYENDTLIVVDKPPGLDVEALKALLPAGATPAHRLDKDTSGVLLVAKGKKTLDFFHQQFQERKVVKKYLCLVRGDMKEGKGRIETLLGRSPNDRRKQKVFLAGEPGSERQRGAVTEYRVIKRYQGYTLIEAYPKTGRKHQLRAQFAYLSHPIAGDKLYGFKNQKAPEGLKRQFLHASSLRLIMPNGEEKELVSELPEDLEIVLKNLSA